MEKEEGAFGLHGHREQVYTGVDVSKDRLDVCLRWGANPKGARTPSSSPTMTPGSRHLGSTPWIDTLDRHLGLSPARAAPCN